MANQDQVDMLMRNFPPEAELLQMSAEDVGKHLLKYMTRGRAETNRFNFLLMVPGGQIAFRFIEGWGWLVRQGFLALAPNDMYGLNHFVTREGLLRSGSSTLGQAAFRARRLRHRGLPRLQGSGDARSEEERF